MIVKSSAYTKLVAVENGKLISIDNRVLRKPIDQKMQNECLTKNSICIVCNFIFGEESIGWSKNVKAICHPFRDTIIFPSNIKTYLFSESDFCDRLITHDSINMKKWDGKYDFVYFTLNSDQGIRSKGLYMAPMIDRVAKRMGLKGLMIGYQGSSSKKLRGTVYNKAYKKVLQEMGSMHNLKVKYKKFIPEEVCSIMRGSRFVLYPNTADASPRLLTEAIVRGAPVVVNKSITGGWKYITNDNGYFFNGITVEEYLNNNDTSENEKSLQQAIEQSLMIDREKISDSFYKNYGFKNASMELANIINSISRTNYKAVAFKAWRQVLKKVARRKGWI